MNKIQIQSENSEFKAKEQLYALFYELTSEIKGKEIELDEEQYITNINAIKMPQLILKKYYLNTNKTPGRSRKSINLPATYTNFRKLKKSIRAHNHLFRSQREKSHQKML